LENLKLFFQLYVRPRAALSAIIDEASLTAGFLAVCAVSLLLSIPGHLRLVDGARHAAEADTDGPVAVDPAQIARSLTMGLAFGALRDAAGIALLYTPGLIFLMTIVDRRAGSFGVALPRDYGAVAPCALYAWSAAHLPVAIVGLALTGRPLEPAVGLGLDVVAIAYFAILMAVAARIIYPIGVAAALLAALVGCLALPLSSHPGLLASPFVLYYLFIYLRGDITAIQWSLGSRRAFKRHLEASTINPNDGEAHYQLGLIHQRRRQYPEAIERFQKAVSIDASEIDAHYQLGRIAREQGRHGDAIRHFESVVARDPKHARHEIWRDVGGTYVDAGDFANARPMLERYVENRPYDPEGLYLLGLTLKKSGETDKARETLLRCVEATKTAPDYRQGELRRWRQLAQAEL
jgi:Flp pilus assembly protein TadD